jgi:putative DNA methylase
MTYRKKLIEVALPLEAINKESAREKSIRHGHPSTLHLWWARRPLAACRAVLFASLVDDPSSHPDEFPTEEAQEKERKRLFEIIEQLVKWENVTNQEVLDAAKAEILKSTDGNPPPVLDPFCGGGSIPLEAQRLGLEAHGSDINPVAVLITKALIEIPPKFANQPPVNPDSRNKAIPNPKSKTQNLQSHYGAQGLAEDVRYYGQWMRDEAFKRIGHLYPKVNLPQEYGGGEATVIAWLWARTVKCPNPACGCQMPLVRSFALSTKKGKEAWVEPVIDNNQKPPVVSFEVKTGKGKVPEAPKTGRGAKFRCLACIQPTDDKYIKAEGVAGRMNTQLMAIVAEGKRGRVYIEPTQQHEDIAHSAQPTWFPDAQIADDKRSMFTPLYGLTHFHHLFSSRQIVALTSFSDLVVCQIHFDG